MGGCSRRLPTAAHLLASVEDGVQDVLCAAVGFVSCSLRVGDWGILMSLVLDVHEMSWVERSLFQIDITVSVSMAAFVGFET